MPSDNKTLVVHPDLSNRQLAEDICLYHQPDEEQAAMLGSMRRATTDFITTILSCCPPSADRTAAVRKAREAMMTANASIVLKGKGIS